MPKQLPQMLRTHAKLILPEAVGAGDGVDPKAAMTCPLFVMSGQFHLVLFLIRRLLSGTLISL